MPVQPKIYVPGQDQKADTLAELYDKLGGSTLAERTAERNERDPKDPFGYKEEQHRTDDYAVAARVAERLTRFFALCVQDFGLTPKAAMFAAELCALNIFNAKDTPATAEQIDEARKLAFDYYTQAIKQIPDPAPPRR